MSSRIVLTISQRPAADDPGVIISRVFCQVTFGSPKETENTHWAIVDTGAPTSLIPHRLWRDCPVLKLKDTKLEGFVARPECRLPVIDGVITCTLLDEQSFSDPLAIRAHLALVDEVPLLLGFSGLLDRARVYFSVAEDEAYLEILQR